MIKEVHLLLVYSVKKLELPLGPGTQIIQKKRKKERKSSLLINVQKANEES